MGFFKRLLTPDDEEALVDGCRELVLGHEDRALSHLQKVVHLADGAYLAGFLTLKRKRLADAERHLSAAAKAHQRLGRYLSKYGLSATMSLPITGEVAAHVGPGLRGVLLGLVELHQERKHWQEAIACLERLRGLDPKDVVVRLSLAELLLEAHPGDKEACRRVVRLAEGVRNDSPIHAALLLYNARALRRLGLADAARTVLTQALRRKKDRDAELLRVLRYERARAYEDIGHSKRARRDLERLYAESPGYEDVAARLGLTR